MEIVGLPPSCSADKDDEEDSLDSGGGEDDACLGGGGRRRGGSSSVDAGRGRVRGCVGTSPGGRTGSGAWISGAS